mmetsp:Transcript_37862/g.83056  ORF Transcript_37862/g.83056 Transcript_37862/m.83056 type:complete len:113 (+) Transcript_37862:775-1113(+)
MLIAFHEHLYLLPRSVCQECKLGALIPCDARPNIQVGEPCNHLGELRELHCQPHERVKLVCVERICHAMNHCLGVHASKRSGLGSLSVSDAKITTAEVKVAGDFTGPFTRVT